MATTAPQNLLFDMNYQAVGTYVTGQINPTTSGYISTGGWGGNPYCSIPFTPPYSGYLPMCFVQQQNGSGGAVGPCYNYSGTTTREYEDTSPPSYYYFTTINTSTILVPEASINNIQVTISNQNTETIRYHVFYVPTSSQIYAPQNLNISSMPWSSDYDPTSNAVTNTQTVSGIASGESVVLQINSSAGYNGSCATLCLIYRPSTEQSLAYQLQSGGSTFYVQAYEGDQINLALSAPNSSANFTTTLTVYNVSYNSTEVGSCTLSANYVLNTPNPPPSWSNVSGTNSGSTNTQTIQGLNVFITLQLNFSTPFTGAMFIDGSSQYNLSGASSQQFSVYNGGYYITFSPTSTYNGTVYVENVNTGATIDSFAVNITVGTNTINATWSDINASASAGGTGSSTASGSTNTVTIPSNLLSAHSLTCSVNANCGSLYAVHNGTQIGVIGVGASVTFSVSANDTLYFTSSLHGTNASKSGTCTIYDNTSGTTITSFDVSLSVSNDQ